jgi:isopentenyl diphosphate isomerase/L-lactate dehydrogenase-like FMN-dependent dehydrogenase
MTRSFGLDRQHVLYQTGPDQDGDLPVVAYKHLRERARGRMTPEIFDYVDGGAGGGSTMEANSAAFDKWRIVPRMLRGVTRPDLSVEILGDKIPFPVILAPIGVQGAMHAEGELATARGAATLGIPLTLSTVSSRPMEPVADIMGSVPHWFQLYWSKNQEFVVSLLDRAKAAGYSTLVVTVDTTQIGWRDRDLENAYLPFMHGQGLGNYLGDPVFTAALDQPADENPRAAVEYFASIFHRTDITWDDLSFLREHWTGPIVLKGILHPDDARLARDHGMDGVIVSNHGGRQVDGAVGALDTLPAVVDAVGEHMPVLFDSGIRRGADAFKALALGAQAVFLGRPYAFGLAMNGEHGVRDAIHNLLAELDMITALAGCASRGEITRDLLVSA